MNSFVFLTFICLMQASSGVSAANNVPVFMLDPSQIMSNVQIDPNPFEKITATAFTEIISESARRSAGVIIFVEETFSAEDISTKDSVYGTPYANLRASLIANKEKVKYFPLVVEPFQQLKLKFPPTTSNVFFLSQHSKLQLQDNFKYIYIFFQDGDSIPKADVLQRHDVIIKKVLDAVRQLKPGPVVAYYTGKSNPIVASKVEFVTGMPAEDGGKEGILIISARSIFHLSGVRLTAASRRAEFNIPPTITEETYNHFQLILRTQFTEFQLEWRFKFLDDRWILDTVAYFEDDEELGFTTLNIGAPYNYSYYCPEPIIITNSKDRSTVIINQIHVQPRRNGSIRQFDQSIHCAPFFNVAILSSLMVVGLCLCITMFGLVSIIDIAPNDRLDDPNGQPLSHDGGQIDV